MYNLFISGDGEAWTGKPWLIELSRCVREYTDTEITKRFGELDGTAVGELKPCIFAYEAGHKKAAKFGLLRDIKKRQSQRQSQILIEYEIKDVDPFLSAEDLSALSIELDISPWELNRTHWAVKDVNLARELKARGISLPAWARVFTKAVDITTHVFDVALSFPGEVRTVVDQIAFE